MITCCLCANQFQQYCGQVDSSYFRGYFIGKAKGSCLILPQLRVKQVQEFEVYDHFHASLTTD